MDTINGCLTWFRYDPATDTWTMVANLSVGRDAIGDKQPFIVHHTFRLLMLLLPDAFLLQGSVCWVRSYLLWEDTMALAISAWLRPMIAGGTEET